MLYEMTWFGESRNSEPGWPGANFSKKCKKPEEDQVSSRSLSTDNRDFKAI